MSEASKVSDNPIPSLFGYQMSKKPPQEIKIELLAIAPIFNFNAQLLLLFGALLCFCSAIVFFFSKSATPTVIPPGAAIFIVCFGTVFLGFVFKALAGLIPLALSMAADIEALKLALEAKPSSANSEATD